MKLRNKFIPLMSVIASTALVAPIATSCNKVEDIAMTNVVDTYIPKYEKVKKSTAASLADVQNLYFSHLMENPGILKDDILKYEADRLPQRISDMEKVNGTQQYVCKNVIANIGVSDPVINKHTAVLEGTEESFYTVSVTIKYQFKYKLVSLDGTYSIEKENNFTNTMNNIPTFVKNINDKLWIHNFLYDVSEETPSPYLQFVKGWNLNFSWSQTSTESWTNSLGEVETSTSDTAQSGTIDRASQLEELVDTSTSSNEFVNFYLKFPSYHLSDVTCGELSNFGFYGFNDNSTLNISCEGSEFPVQLPTLSLFKLPSDMELDKTSSNFGFTLNLIDTVFKQRGDGTVSYVDPKYLQLDRYSTEGLSSTGWDIDVTNRLFKINDAKLVSPAGQAPFAQNYTLTCPDDITFELQYKNTNGEWKTATFVTEKEYYIFISFQL